MKKVSEFDVVLMIAKLDICHKIIGEIAKYYMSRTEEGKIPKNGEIFLTELMSIYKGTTKLLDTMVGLIDDEINKDKVKKL